MANRRRAFIGRHVASTVSVVIGLVAGVVGVVPSAAFADEVRDGAWWADEIGLEAAHEVTRGYGVTVGILDSGVDASHPDLEGQVVDGWSPWADGDEGRNDTIGHGTAMAALVAGKGHGPGNADGILGVAPEARIITAGIAPHGLQTEFGEATFSDGDVQRGMQQLVDRGADVILTALGGSFSDPTQDLFEKIAKEHQIPIIGPAGNTADGDTSVPEPATWPEVFAVSGTSPGGTAWDGSVAGYNVALSAPADVMDLARPGGGYERALGGTSAASAITAGVVALMKAQWPDMTQEEIEWRITETARDAGEEGPDDAFGFGIVDAYAALTATVDEPERSGLDVNPEPNPIRPSESATESTQEAAPTVVDGGVGSWVWFAVGGVVVVAVAVTVLVIGRARRRGQVAVPAQPGPDGYPTTLPAPLDQFAPGSGAPQSFPHQLQPTTPHGDQGREEPAPQSFPPPPPPPGA